MKFNHLGKYKTGQSGSVLQLSVPLPQTPAGRVYRRSPNEDAHPRNFVLGNAHRPALIADEVRARMKLEPGSQQTVCPYSGTVAADGDFTHPDDVEAAISVIRKAAVRDAADFLSKSLADMARGSRFISYKPGSRPPLRSISQFAREDLLRALTCDHCGRDYGVYAIGLFCPDCGAPNLRLHFRRETELVDDQIELARSLDQAQQELAYRLLGNAHEDVLTAFEATLKAVYHYASNWRGEPRATKPVRNDFQNIARGRERFAEFDLDPFDTLNDAQLETLELNIQKRHVIGHNLGIIDSKFASQADEARLGQTISLVGDDIHDFAVLGQMVVDRLDAWLCGVEVPASLSGEASEQAGDRPSSQSDARVSDAARRLGMSELAVRVGMWLAEQSENGLPDPADGDALLTAFEGAEKGAIENALAELKAEDCVSTLAVTNSRIPRISVEKSLFEMFDPIARRTGPRDDAKSLSKLILAGPDQIDVGQLLEQSKWERRRFNPALGLILEHIDSDHISKTIVADLPTRHFFLNADDRLSVRRAFDL